jgi:hypothetical protein
MSYQNPDYETKLAEVKARKILGGLKRKNAGRERKEKEAVKGIVSKRKSEIDQKVLEIESKKLEEAEKKLRTKAKVHPKPERPKSLVIENTQEAIKAPPPFKETAVKRGRGGANALGRRVYTAEQLAERRAKEMADSAKFAEEMDKKYASVGGFIGQLKIRIAEDALAEIERKAEAIRMKDKEYRDRKNQDAYYARLYAEYSD